MIVDLAELSTEQLTASFNRRAWKSLSFPSTLYLQPVMDVLLLDIPPEHQFEVQLGLQEAIVNAARHGNGLDPSKSVSIRYAKAHRELCWIITDEGQGFVAPTGPCDHWSDSVPCESGECGRGLFILFQVFDQVKWNNHGTQLALYKRCGQPRRKSFGFF
ncbi:MAG: ATP-binding protein [Gammaproteobacteria bacterium]|nr:ATP-binding protein [Gammaproteobacteria bacterium]